MSLPRTLARLAAGLSALACTSLVAALAPAAAQAAERPRPLRVMTFNMHHGAGPDDVLDLADTARTIRANGADVVGLQEVDRHWGERSGFADEARWLSRRLHMHVVFGANLDEDPLEPGQPRRQYGTAILSRYPILSWSNTFLTKAGQPETEQRGLLYARLMVRGVPVRFYNTHLQHTSGAIRVAQVEQIKKLIGTTDEPTVLTGDLNAEPSSPEIASITAMFADTWREVGVGDGYTFDTRNPHARIDYVLTSADVAARRARVVDSTASDHLPLRVDLALPCRR